MEIKENSIAEGPFWPEPVEVKKVEDLGDELHIIGTTLNSRQYVEQLLPKFELNKIKEFSFSLDFSAPGEDVFLAIEGERFRFASLFDPLLAVNVSKIDPLPFQIEAVYGYVLTLPRVRFLIADDPGAGKTIMAGLIIKELKLRRIVNRILIVVPGHLKPQWQREMNEKFHESFRIIDRSALLSHYGENPWERESQVITSMDFAKREEVLPSLASTSWDLVIVDESHKLAAYKYGEKIEKSERYKLGEVLSKISEHLLFLTATPHKGDPDNYRLFLDLLRPGFFAKNEYVEESITNRDNPLFIRRLKEDMKDFEGRPIFTRRYPKTINFELSPEEQKLYYELSKYVISQYNKALKSEKKRNIAFALLILQRRMASSTFALMMSLKRRKKRLEEFLIKEEIPEEKIPRETFEEIEDEEEKERWEKEKIWETVTAVKDKEELKKEIKTIENLIEKAEEILRKEVEVKIKELKKAIEEGFKKIREIGGNEKILIFTESKDTLEYLVEKIRSWEYSVNFIHGGMPLEERIKAEKIFKNETQVLVATEAAGEGINLQFCHIMINYDIPWNPNRLEQRMGRIHRYGQQKDVYIFNLVAKNTKEGTVLSRVLEKLEEIRNALGSDKVFDVIGDIFHGKNLYQLIIDAITEARTMDEILEGVDLKVDREYIEKIKNEILGESLATRYIDYTKIKEMAEKAKENRLIPEYVEEFFKKGFLKAGGNLRIRKDGFLAVDSIPYEIRKIAEEVNFKNKYGLISKTYKKITFDKEIAFKNPDAEFVSFGHPLLEALLEWIKRKFFKNLQKGGTFKDPSGRYNGIIWFYEGEIKDGKGEIAGKKLLSIYDDGKILTEINPSILWDLVPSKSIDAPTIEYNENESKKYAIKTLEKYKEELWKERKRQIEIKKKYGIRSLNYLIENLDAELVELYERQSKGEKVELPIRNKEERKRDYQKALEELEKELEAEGHLVKSMPKLIGAVYVKKEEGEEAIKEEIEKIGMKVAIEYEKKNGRYPEDVSEENLGFDIRSKGKGEIRYIEVKAKEKEGEIVLTPNEWFKAKRFGKDYYLYIITNALKEPALYIINNPAEKLNPQEKIEIVRFIVPLEEWKSKTDRQSSHKFTI